LSMVYHDGVDKAGHKGGPGSQDVGKELAAIDKVLGKFMATKAAQQANVIIVSDHGIKNAILKTYIS